MKDIFQIAKLISKEKLDHLSEEEKMELHDWLSREENNPKAYKRASDSQLIQKNHDLYAKIDMEQSWNNLTKRQPGLKTLRITHIKTVLKWAAVILLPLLVTTYLVTEVNWNSNEQVVEAGKAKATLQLEDGKTISLEDYQGKVIKSGKERLATNADNNLIYNQGEVEEELLAYNTITTPTQGEYTMVLSDGTKVWLNAQSQLKYPVKFGKGKREVELDGEAYFEVAHDASKPFIVNLAKGADVEVLGTEFNVMAYDDENEVQTTLVEGEVRFSYEDSNVLLSPGMQSSLYSESNEIEVREVRTYQYTAWKDGKFVFSREPLSSVFRKMSRWYGIEVDCKDETILNRRISGVMNKYENVDELIDLIQEVSPIHIEREKQLLRIREE